VLLWLAVLDGRCALDRAWHRPGDIPAPRSIPARASRARWAS